MQVKVFAVFDTKAQLYGAPVLFNQEGEAVRWFTGLVNGQFGDCIEAKYPADYVLYRIGSFDRDTAVVENDKAPSALGHGSSFVTGKVPPAASMNGVEVIGTK